MFGLTPLDAQPLARSVRDHFLSQRFRVEVDRAAYPDAPYRTTLTCRRIDEIKLVECQSRLDYHPALKAFHHFLAERRLPAELSVAVAESDEETISAARLREMDRDGVGLLMLERSAQLTVIRKPCNWAYFATPDPALKFGSTGGRVTAAFHKYNREDRVDGMRELSDLVEGETRRLARAGRTQGRFVEGRVPIEQMRWNDLINRLAAREATPGEAQPILPEGLKNDLHSFRGGRDSVDHPVRSAAEGRRRSRQFQDRMLLGARLISDLDACRRSLARRPGSHRSGAVHGIRPIPPRDDLRGSAQARTG